MRLSGSSTSKKLLNRPEYDAAKTGVTAISASARRTCSTAVARSPEAKPVSMLSASACANGRSSMTSISTDSPSAWSARVAAAEPVREQAGRGRVAQAGADDGEAAGHA